MHRGLGNKSPSTIREVDSEPPHGETTVLAGVNKMTRRYYDYQEAGTQQKLGPLFDQQGERKMPDETPIPAAVTIDPLKFMLAGKARFTIVSKQTGKRYTYKISASKWVPDEKHPRIYWVSLLTGSDNESSFSYMATIFADAKDWQRAGDMRLTPKSRYTPKTEPFVAIKFLWDFLRVHSRLPNTLELWHEGRCARCGRVLTVPESIASGFGPECRGKV